MAEKQVVFIEGVTKGVKSRVKADEAKIKRLFDGIPGGFTIARLPISHRYNIIPMFHVSQMIFFTPINSYKQLSYHPTAPNQLKIDNNNDVYYILQIYNQNVNRALITTRCTYLHYQVAAFGGVFSWQE